MKKLFALLISLAFSFMLLAGCMERPDDIRVYMPDGAPRWPWPEWSPWPNRGRTA